MHWPSESDKLLVTAVITLINLVVQGLSHWSARRWRKRDHAVKQAQVELLQENTEATVAVAEQMANERGLTLDQLKTRASEGIDAIRKRYGFLDEGAGDRTQAGPPG